MKKARAPNRLATVAPCAPTRVARLAGRGQRSREMSACDSCRERRPGRRPGSTGRALARAASRRRRVVLAGLVAVALAVAAVGAGASWAWAEGPVVEVGHDALPRVALRGGFALTGERTGPPGAVAALEATDAAPLSLTAVDLDEDGVSDLVVGYILGDGSGAIELRRGNLALLWPDPATPSADVPPFLGPTRVLALPTPPDRIAAGDLDGDGHADVAAVTLGRGALQVLLGDGRGGLGAAFDVSLPGVVTALAAGEVNRRDGILDLVLGVTRADGDWIVVLEGPDGALAAVPETIAAPAPVADLALGQLDDDALLDLAAAAGEELVVVHGRDRLLSADGEARRGVAPPRVDRLELGDEVVSVAVGAFAGDEQVVACLLGGGEVVLVEPRRPAAGRVAVTPHHVLSPAAFADGGRVAATRTSAFPGSDLLLVEPAAGRLELVPAAGRGAGGEQPAAAALDVAGEPVAVLPLRLNKDGLLDLVVAVDRPPAIAVVLTGPRAVFVVNTPDYVEDQVACDGLCDNGGGLCSTVAASAEAACTSAADEIQFAVGTIASGPHSVVSGGGAGGPLTVDGTSFGSLVRIDAVNLGAFGSVVRGMDAGAVTVASEGGQIVEGNLVGHGGAGIRVVTSGCTVGGTTVEARNIVIENSLGIEIQGDGNVVIGNYVGLDATGTSTGHGNTSDGVRIESGSDNTIGGTTVTRRNLISSNQTGLSCAHLAPDNLIQGNYIGTDVTGTLRRGNSYGGVILLAGGTTVGGTIAAARNVIAGGSYGVRVSSVSSGDAVLIQGNHIGTNAAGSAGLGFDLAGVGVESSSGVRVGGEATGAGNLISGVAVVSSWAGVSITGATGSGNVVQGNLIGTDSSGTAAIPNYRGIRILDADTNTIGGVPTGPPGGPCVPPCNLISGSTLSGVTLSGDASGNLVIGNFIGTDLDGLNPLANVHYGVDAAGSSNGIGVDGAGNLISGNQRSGIWLRGTGNRVHDNLIGTDATGAGELGNVQYGLWVNGANAEIGAAGAGNVISGNTWPAILLDGAPGATVQGNLVGTQADGESPLGNHSMGIWLYNGASGATIGGTGPGEANVVAHNTWAGIRLEGPDYAAGTGNRMLSNVIHSNGALGIDLGAWGPEPNDPLDPDTGPNQLQNYPKLTAVSVTATDTAVQGFLQSLPSTAFTLQLYASEECDPSGYGEAEVLLGSETVATDAGGHVSFSLTFPAVMAGAHAFAATATDPDGNTSELSRCQSDLTGADVETTKTGPATVEPGQTVEYVVRAVNIGVGYAFGVEISDDLPACLTSITCAVSTGTCVVDGSSVTASVGTLEPDEEAVLTISAQVGPTCIGILTNTARSFCLEDLNPSNDDDDVQTMVGLFSDGFESGGTTSWSSSAP